MYLYYIMRKSNLKTILIFSIVILILCLIYLFFTMYFEGADSPNWNVKSFTPLTDKDIKNGNAMNPKNNNQALGGRLPGSTNVPKQSDCLIIKDNHDFSVSEKGVYSDYTNKTCGKSVTFTTKDSKISDNLKKSGNLTCVFNNKHNPTNFKAICHADGKDNASSNFYKISS